MSYPAFSVMVRQMINPTLVALRNLGGSGSNRELNATVIDALEYPEEIVQYPHGETNTTEVEWRLAWARTYLRGAGLISNSSRGVWALTPKGRESGEVDPQEVIRSYPRLSPDLSASSSGDMEEESPEEGLDWRTQLSQALLSMTPAGFERLCQRLLRESGFYRC